MRSLTLLTPAFRFKMPFVGNVTSIDARSEAKSYAAVPGYVADQQSATLAVAEGVVMFEAMVRGAIYRPKIKGPNEM